LFSGDIGGTAGLFLGGSFITVLELVYYIGRVFHLPKKKEKKKKKRLSSAQNSNGHVKGREDSVFTMA
jgi:hypothetical protein